MPIALAVRDETTTGETLNELVVQFLTEQVTVRDLIRSRVYQEVTDHNARAPHEFRTLVQPTDAERTLTGFRFRDPKTIDPGMQFEMAIEGFTQNRMLLLVDDRQMESLDDKVELRPDTRVSFLTLVPLVGG